MNQTFEENDVTHEMVLSRFVFVKPVGKLVWLRRPREHFDDANKWSVWNSRYAGQFAGRVGLKGYRIIEVFGKIRKASRLIWMYHYGYWPDVVDHIDGDRLNDAIDNLRDVTQSINCKNRALGSRNKTGVSGVYLDNGAVRAQINVNGRRIYLGSFDTVEDARLARREAEKRFGFHENHGRTGTEG